MIIRLPEIRLTFCAARGRVRSAAPEPGLNFSAIVFVTLREGDRQAVSAFEAAVKKIPQITQAQRLFGDPDYLLNVITRDLQAFQALYDKKLSAITGVQRLTSTLVMKTVVKDRALPFLRFGQPE